VSKVDSIATDRYPLPPQQSELPCADRRATIGAHDAVPWQVV
jgi:hypothetical protein